MPRVLKSGTPPRKARTRSATPGTRARPITPTERPIAEALLAWFRSQARDLPWRRTRDPYAIWISEIMLQQTQVRTVIPYWERWMQTFPTPSVLAQAPESQFLKLWEGLGYYRRARNLHKAAQHIVAVHHGQFPTSPEDILELPGVGRYTLGAIASIAYNLPLPILDGNVIRVLSRIHAASQDPASRPGADWYWARAEALVQTAAQLPAHHHPQFTGNCSALNQSLMELGATLCTPRAPQCPACPIQSHCRAFQQKRVELFPPPKARPTVTQRHLHVWIILDRDRKHLLLRQRSAGEINGGFWEFPEVETAPTSHPSTPDPSELVGFAAQLLQEERLKLKHGITRYRFEITATLHEPRSGASTLPRPRPGLQWVDRAELGRLPMTTAHRKLAQTLPHQTTPPPPRRQRGRKSPPNR